MMPERVNRGDGRGWAKWRELLADESWAARPAAATPWMIGATTFCVLVLELAFIRWTSGQMRAFAYFNNLVLVMAFLGLGVGVALGRRLPGLVYCALPALLVVALPLGFAEALGLVHLRFPDQSVALWGAEMQGDALVFARSLAVFLAALVGIGAVFVAAGAPLGFLFGRMQVLRAYAADLAGSLLGIVAFTAMAWANVGPAVWLGLGVAPLVWLTRRWSAAALAIGVVALGLYSEKTARFSPYNRIELFDENMGMFLRLDVNRDFHQYLHDLSDARIANPQINDDERATLRRLRAFYDLPFTLNARRDSALVVGAGTGNDVQAALRNGYGKVTSVDIDGQILALGRERHPEQPYADPRTRIVTDDARSFFEKYRGPKFDVVCFGLLDSHAMASAMSTLRLDNYVYTEEGVRAAWRHVAPGGHLSLAMSCASGDWFFERFYWTVTKATGREPIALHTVLHGGSVTFIVPTEGAVFDPQVFREKTLLKPAAQLVKTLTLTDDWPFLYLRPATVPWGYFAVLTFVLGLAALTVRPVFGIGRGGAAFDWPLFLMGAAFLLIETRGVTSLSLLFGSTWVVNSAVFAGILVMVLLASLAVERWRWSRPEPWFGALFAAVALLWFFPVAWLQGLPLFWRGVAGGLLTGVPVGLAGIVVPMLLARSPQPAVALGANLLGAVLGGCLEYYSMIGGMRSTAAMALVLYLAAYLVLKRKERTAAVSSVTSTMMAAR